jgi:hypothetical protein
MEATYWAAFLKPIIGAVFLFILLLLARFGAVALFKWMPEGRVKRLLLKKW